MYSRNHMTIHVKSNDQLERFPKNTRGVFSVELNSKYKLDPLKKYTVCINSLSVNNDIDDVRIIYKEVKPMVMTTIVWDDEDLCIPKDFDWQLDLPSDAEFDRRVQLPKHSHFHDKNDIYYHLPLVDKKAYLDTLDPEIHMERAKERFDIDMHTWENELPFNMLEEKYKTNKPYYLANYPDGKYYPKKNCYYKQAKLPGTNTILTIVMYISGDSRYPSRFVYYCEIDIPNLTLTLVNEENEEGHGVKLTLQSMYNFIRDVIGNSHYGRITPLSYIGDSTTYQKGWTSMVLASGYELFTMDVPNEVRTIMDLTKPMTVKKGQVLNIWRWYEKVHYINTRLFQHFCIELKDCENNTLSTRARSVLKVCSLKTPSSSKTQFKYLHVESQVLEHVEITSDHIRQLSFSLTDIYGEPLKFRNIEEEQAAFPTIVSLTIQEHGEYYRG